jgi:hypothetical protein
VSTARAATAALVLAAVLSPALPARADPPAPAVSPAPAPSAAAPPAPVRGVTMEEVSGIDHPPPKTLGDRVRGVADALLVGPRALIDLIFQLSGSANNIVHDQRIVELVQQMANPRPGTIAVYPTFIAETGRNPIIGLRSVASGGTTTTSFRVGFGGINELTGEGVLYLSRPGPLPGLLTFEALADRRTDLQYVGLGQVPATDPRNRFTGAPGTGLYREQRVRQIVKGGIRPSSIVELSLSTSVARVFVDDAPETGARAVGAVFDRRSIPGLYADSTIVYSEAVVRVDTRTAPELASPGWLFEAYGGAARGPGSKVSPLDASRQSLGEVAFVRMGGRAVAFVPIYRKTNTLSPGLTLDGLAPLDGLAVPFTELPREPQFRGLDNRRDYVSLVGSLDYRWQFIHSAAARLFFDAATVGPRVQSLALGHPRVAVGFGLDVFTSGTELGRAAFAVSSDGLFLLFSFRIPLILDRQHHE